MTNLFLISFLEVMEVEEAISGSKNPVSGGTNDFSVITYSKLKVSPIHLKYMGNISG